MFQQLIAFIRRLCLPQNLFRQYLCCGCIWITICPVWPVFEGCDQECIVGSVPAGTKPTIHSWLHSTAAGQTERTIIHIHLRRRQHWSNLQGTCKPLKMAVSCRNMSGNLISIIKSYKTLEDFLVILNRKIQKFSVQLSRKKYYIYLLQNNFLPFVSIITQ
jgi:hypothetical protein